MGKKKLGQRDQYVPNTLEPVFGRYGQGGWPGGTVTPGWHRGGGGPFPMSACPCANLSLCHWNPVPPGPHATRCHTSRSPCHQVPTLSAPYSPHQKVPEPPCPQFLCHHVPMPPRPHTLCWRFLVPPCPHSPCHQMPHSQHLQVPVPPYPHSPHWWVPMPPCPRATMSSCHHVPMPTCPHSLCQRVPPACPRG